MVDVQLAGKFSTPSSARLHGLQPYTLMCFCLFLTVDCWQINRPPRIVSHLKFVSRLDRLSLQFTGGVAGGVPSAYSEI